MKAQKPFFTPLKEVVDIILDYFNVTLVGNIPIGVTIDSKPNFGKHIQTKVNKANQIVGIIRRSFKYLDFKTFCLLFKSRLLFAYISVTGVLVSLIALYRSSPSYPVTFVWLYVGYSRLHLSMS
jgi:hypothetical protein